MYIVTSFVFFVVGGLLALMMRAELARPGLQFLAPCTSAQPNFPPGTRADHSTRRAGLGRELNE